MTLRKCSDVFVMSELRIKIVIDLFDNRKLVRAEILNFPIA